MLSAISRICFLECVRALRGLGLERMRRNPRDLMHRSSFCSGRRRASASPPQRFLQIIRNSGSDRVQLVRVAHLTAALGAVGDLKPLRHRPCFCLSGGHCPQACRVPAAVGVALGDRARGVERTVVATIGDGSLQYSVQAIWTAAQHDFPVVFVVMRNKEYSILKAFALLEKAPGVPGMDLPGLDIVSIATGFGCRAVHADTT